MRLEEWFCGDHSWGRDLGFSIREPPGHYWASVDSKGRKSGGCYLNFYRQFGLIGASMAIEVRHPAAAGLARQAIRDRQLAELRPRVEEVREQFQTELRRLPAPFAEMASSHFAGRSAKARNVVMMGEYVPWLLGDALGNPPPETAKAAIAWMFLYEHQLVVDDAVDTESVNPLHAVLLSNLLPSVRWMASGKLQATIPHFGLVFRG